MHRFHDPLAAPARPDADVCRTQLLVSVRSADEARAALAGGADIIDIKEPARGPLGAADWSTIAAVIEVVGNAAPVSAALGELLGAAIGLVSQDSASQDLANSLVGRLQFVKFGLAGCAARPADWRRRWLDVVASAAPTVTCVPVAYADAESAAAPALEAAIDWAVAAGCSLLLVDTFQKGGADLPRLCSQAMLGDLLRSARGRGLRLGLAGGLGGQSLAEAISLGPELVGVRGAACDGGRLGTVRESRVRELAALMAGQLANKDRQPRQRRPAPDAIASTP